MSRITESFHKSEKPRLIPFIVFGDPDLSTSMLILHELQNQGVLMVELGFPYSDPLADGPIIQRASQRALNNDITVEVYFSFVKRARQEGITIPLVFFSYYNPILQYGVERFFKHAREAGLDGAIIVDLPYEESIEIIPFAEQHNIDLIPLVAPTSGSRIAKIVSNAHGFIYCVSSLGVTGTRITFANEMYSFLEEVKQHAQIPLAVGFGVSNKVQVDSLSQFVDAVVVGSALVSIIEQYLKPEQMDNESVKREGLAKVKEYIKSLLN